MKDVNDLIGNLNTIQGWSGPALVFFSSIVFGYVLRGIKRFPNDGIPMAVVLWGAVFMLLLADPRAPTQIARLWVVRNFVVGLIMGFAAWMAHNIVLSRIEDWMVKMFPDKLGNTDFFRRPQPQQPPDPTQEDKSQTKQP